jgi:hypothetical protein
VWFGNLSEEVFHVWLQIPVKGRLKTLLQLEEFLVREV